MSKLPRLDTTITFSDVDLEGCQHPYDDPLVIRVVVANKTVHRVLIDNGSSADIIFISTFDKMGIGREKLESVNAHLRGFSEEKVLLWVSTTSTHFGRPPMPGHNDNKIPHSGGPIGIQHVIGWAFSQCHKGYPFAYHMVIKFPTENGVGIVRGNQQVARECYLASMKQKAMDNIHMDELNMRDELDT